MSEANREMTMDCRLCGFTRADKPHNCIATPRFVEGLHRKIADLELRALEAEAAAGVMRGALEEIARSPQANCAMEHDPPGKGYGNCDCAGEMVRSALRSDVGRKAAAVLTKAEDFFGVWNKGVHKTTQEEVDAAEDLYDAIMALRALDGKATDE